MLKELPPSKETTTTLDYSKKVENKPYHSPTPGKITIAAMTPTVGSVIPDAALCKDLRQCYFNSAMFIMAPYTDVIDMTVINCVAGSISPIIRCPEMENNASICKNLVQYFVSIGSLAGWWLSTPTLNELKSNLLNPSDKPDTAAFNYNTVISTIKSTDQIVVMDVFANSEEAGGNYRDYLMCFQDYVKPSSWGTTVFPAIIRNNVEIGNLDLFYRDLEILSLIARYSGRPFWFTVRCQSFTAAPSNTSTPAPTEQEMRFTAFSALAYGAQGLQYWSYHQLENSDGITYHTAPLDSNGGKQYTLWYWVKTINLEVSILNNVFFESEVVQVKHTGTTQYDATMMLKGSIGPIMAMTTEDVGVLISHLNTHGQDYLLIVNHAFRASDPYSQTVKIHFSNLYEVRQLVIRRDQIEELVPSANENEYTLLRGAYLLFKWN